MMDNKETIKLYDNDGTGTSGIRNCARCGEDHGISYRRFKKNPVESYDYWAMCPTLNEPILIKVIINDQGMY